MKVISDAGEMRRFCRRRVAELGELALVPTMGALHEGHLQLVREATKRGLTTIVSIFVNPTQFGPGEDYARYPRALEKDLRALDALGGVDAVFAPGVDDMYPAGIGGLATVVAVSNLPDHLCGAFRPGHFDGVTTVVSKLFNICVPTVAFFGRKDAQQFVILSRMVRDLDFGIEVVGVETVREKDGLALSSRNDFLSEEERAQATVLYQAVSAAREAILTGERRPDVIVGLMRQMINEAPLARLQYAELVSAQTLQPLSRVEPGADVLAAVAVFFGQTRLIDNVFVTAP